VRSGLTHGALAGSVESVTQPPDLNRRD
jgi:hypothetical protein